MGIENAAAPSSPPSPVAAQSAPAKTATISATLISFRGLLHHCFTPLAAVLAPLAIFIVLALLDSAGLARGNAWAINDAVKHPPPLFLPAETAGLFLTQEMRGIAKCVTQEDSCFAIVEGEPHSGRKTAVNEIIRDLSFNRTVLLHTADAESPIDEIMRQLFGIPKRRKSLIEVLVGQIPQPYGLQLANAIEQHWYGDTVTEVLLQQPLQSSVQPVLVIDEAQTLGPTLFSELATLAARLARMRVARMILVVSNSTGLDTAAALKKSPAKIIEVRKISAVNLAMFLEHRGCANKVAISAIFALTEGYLPDITGAVQSDYEDAPLDSSIVKLCSEQSGAGFDAALAALNQSLFEKAGTRLALANDVRRCPRSEKGAVLSVACAVLAGQAHRESLSDSCTLASLEFFGIIRTSLKRGKLVLDSPVMGSLLTAVSGGPGGKCSTNGPTAFVPASNIIPRNYGKPS
jgi:hypothetical protein